MKDITSKTLFLLIWIIVVMSSLYWYREAQFINHDISLGLFFAEIILDPTKVMYLDFYEEGLPFNQYIYLIPALFGSLFKNKYISILLIQIFTLFSTYLLSLSLVNFLRNRIEVIFLTLLTTNLLLFSEFFGHYQMNCAMLVLSFIFFRHETSKSQEKQLILLTPLAAISLLIRPHFFALVMLNEFFLYLNFKELKKYLRSSKIFLTLIVLIFLGTLEVLYQAYSKESFFQYFLSYFTQRDSFKDSILSLLAPRAPFLLFFLAGSYKEKNKLFSFSALALMLSIIPQRNWQYHFLMYYYFIIVHIFMSFKELTQIHLAKFLGITTAGVIIFSTITHQRIPSVLREYSFFNDRIDTNLELFKKLGLNNKKVAYLSKNIMPKFPNTYLLSMELTQKNIALENFYLDHNINTQLFNEVANDISQKKPTFLIIEKNEPPLINIQLENELFRIAPSIVLQYNKFIENNNIVIYKIRENFEEK